MRDGWLEAETLETLRAATPKFEAKRHGASDHSNNCRLVPLANILPQTLQALLIVNALFSPRSRELPELAGGPEAVGPPGLVWWRGAGAGEGRGGKPPARRAKG